MFLKNRFILLFLLSVINSQLFGQINYNFKTINDNSNTSYFDSLRKIKGHTIIFFCPTYNIDSNVYKFKAKQLVSDRKISSFKSIKIYFILFKEDSIENSKGIPLRSIDKTISLPSISQLECFFLNFEKDYVKRARIKDKFNFEYKQPFPNENFYRIQIVDTNKCFKEIPDRIPFYADFIKEAYSPSYSLEEKVDILTDSIKTLQQNVNDLKATNENILIKLDLLLNQNNLSSPKKVKMDKVLNENSSKDQPQIPEQNNSKDVIIDPNVKVNTKGKNK